jgi:hypothetical protein
MKTHWSEFLCELLGWCLLLAILMGICVLAIAEEPRESCTWDITYYLLGEKHRSQSKQAWSFTPAGKAQFFGALVEGHVLVEPGHAYFICNGKRVEIVVAPIEGSVKELK